MKAVAIETLIGLAVAITLASVLGMMRLRDPYQRMHYIAPPASLGALFITAAIFLERGLKPESFKALFATVVLIGMNAVVTHAAGRAFRIAETENWRPKPGEEVPILRKDKQVERKEAA
jgi:monovalent cation/proton antiporter MnhG/PhaG subunit